MNRRDRTFGIVVTLLAATLLPSGCWWSKPAARQPAPTPTLASQTATPAIPDSGATPNETPEHAARRLFSDLYETALALADHPEMLQGSQAGRPVPVSRDYSSDRPILARWTLSDDAKSVSGDMFAEMRTSAVSKTVMMVPVTKNGRAISEFEMAKGADGLWVASGDLASPLPSGEIYDLESATAKLRKSLGAGTIVRPAVFLPSGLVFAVGDNHGQEAAVFLLPITHGPGIAGFTDSMPNTGAMLSRSQLRELYRKKTQPPPSTRFVPGQLD